MGGPWKRKGIERLPALSQAPDMPIETGTYHLVGVAGVGMSALAQVLLARGHTVTGSDRHIDQGEELDVLDKLAGGGVTLLPQDGSGVHDDTTAVVTSTAIEPDNPDMEAANRKGIPLLHRAEMLAEVIGDDPCVAVTGTSGKTTVTAMIGWVLERLGRDPTVVNGGALLDWMDGTRIGNVRVGDSGFWVIEADESDRSLLRFSPDWAVLTNISKDHFRVTEAVSLFHDFLGCVSQVVVCGEGVITCLGGHRGPPSLFEVENPLEKRGDTWCFQLEGVDFRIPLPGRHNAQNALVAAALCVVLGLDTKSIRDALSSFRGVQRRLETVGEAGGIRVIDDYAHNPAKIRAAWVAAAEQSERVLGIWRPHGYGPLAAMKDELADVLADVMGIEDQIFILPVFDAGGTADRSVSSNDLVKLLYRRGVKVEYVQGYGQLLAYLPSLCREGDTVLSMGARDPALPKYARALLRALGGKA